MLLVFNLVNFRTSAISVSTVVGLVSSFKARTAVSGRLRIYGPKVRIHGGSLTA